MAKVGEEGEIVTVELPDVAHYLSDENDGKNYIDDSPWLSRFTRQTKALTKKNFLSLARNKSSTCAQFLVAPLFLLMLLLTKLAIENNSGGNSYRTLQERAQVIDVGDFQSCIPGVQNFCYDFVYAIEDTDKAEGDDVISRLQTYLGIDSSRTLEFNDTSEVDAYLLNNQNVSKVALILHSPSIWGEAGAKLEYTLQVNFTATCKDLNILGCDEPLRLYSAPMQLALDSVLLDKYGNYATPPEIEANFADFPHPELPNEIDALERFGTVFLYVAICFNYIVQVSTMAQEKEAGLVEYTRTNGMMDSSYWISYIISNTTLNVISIGLLILTGYILDLELFVETDGGLLFIGFFLISMAFTAFGFFTVSLFQTASGARGFSIGFFLLGLFVAPILTSLLYFDGNDEYDVARPILSLFPHFAVFAITEKLIGGSAGASAPGLTWEDRKLNILTLGENDTSVWTLEDIFELLVASFFMFTFLAWYLSKVIPDRNSYREPFYFLFKSEYWFGSKGASNTYAERKRIENYLGKSEDEEVEKEAENVMSQNYTNREVAVELLGLEKYFKQGPIKVHAVDGVTYGIDKDQLMVMLGHNGAGKTTTFNVLTGLTKPTGGDALVFGESVKHSMDKIRPMMGVCPQHDVLWPLLTPREHMGLLADIKGINKDLVEKEVQNRLEDVRLEGVGHQIVSEFSGGMRRRLSLSLSLLGNPKIVYLDEPTTGMDPVTRRAVWDMIARAKKGRVIILTTHSMEEADILGDRVAIMSQGKMKALGTSLRLKSKYGSGYRMTLMTGKGASSDDITKFVTDNSPVGAALLTSTEQQLLFQLEKTNEDSDIGKFFEALESKKTDLGIEDMSIGLTTLEEVFLNLESSNDHQPVEVAEYMKGKVENKRKPTGFVKQFRALATKTFQYQRTQKTSCCCLTCFPALVVLAMLAIQLLVVRIPTVELLCGEGVTEDECKSKGPSLTCLASLVESTTTFPVGIQVGQISDSFIADFNPNCDQDGVCFENLEQPDFADIPITTSAGSQSTAGSINISIGSDDVVQSVLEWYADIKLVALTSGGCQSAFVNNFDADVVCKGKSGNDKNDCVDDVRDLRQVLIFLEEQENVFPPSIIETDITKLCTPGSGAATPSQSLIDTLTPQITVLRNERTACLLSSASEFWQRLGNPSGLNIRELLLNATNDGSGFLSSFTTKDVPDLDIETLFSSISQGLGLSNSEACDQFVQNITDDPVTAVPAILLLTGASSADQILNLCALISNYDAVRFLSSKIFSSSNSMDKDIFDSWFGKKVETEFASQYSFPDSNLDYLRRQYYTRWTAYDISQADATTGKYSYTGYYNNTGTGGFNTGNWFSVPYFLNNAILRDQTSNNQSLLVNVKTMPAKFKCNRDEWLDGKEELDCPSLLPFILQASFADFIGSFLFPIIFLVHILFITLLIVYEKSAGLVLQMKMAGLNAKVYWIVNYLFWLLQFLLLTFVLWAVSRYAVGVKMFVIHDQSIVLFYLFTWANTLVAFSFLLSCFFSNENTATAIVLVFIFLLLNTGRTILDELTLNADTPNEAYAPLMILPPLTMMRGVLVFAYGGAFNSAITSENWTEFVNGAIPECIWIMWLQWIICLALTFYFDQVLSNGAGVGQPLNFFLKKEYWFPEKSTQLELNSLKTIGHAEQVNVNNLTENKFDDVKEEYGRVVNSDSESTVRVVRLNKTFGNGKVAVKSLSLGIKENECFGLLGHNGAGKTTTINMLVGLYRQTSGGMFVDGYDLSTDINQVRSLMGVCPQDNIIWNTLSVNDHLRFYGRLKGLTGSALRKAVQEAAEQVNLSGVVGFRRAGKLSGGMKRRLSVAIALIGNPKIVYLDEPSTGLDPASRRQLWQVIKNAKGDKSIILTTHSMEEADVLCDRLGIMAVGEMQCIGTAANLKRRFGEGYALTVTAENTPESYSDINRFVTELFPTARLLNEPLGGTSKFEVRREEVRLSKVFREFIERKERLKITDWGITETTLEEVFLKVAVDANVEEEITKAVESKSCLNFMR